MNSPTSKQQQSAGLDVCPACGGSGMRANGTNEVSVTFSGKVQKIIPAVARAVPEKAQIALTGADDLYREIRIVSTLTDEQGNVLRLTPGTIVDVVIKAPGGRHDT